MGAVTRAARGADTGGLKNVWKTAFGDTDEFIGMFFKHYGAQTATVATLADEIAAAGYLLPVGSLNLPDGGKYPCAMIYSVAVLPAHRGRGIGAELTRALIAAGHEAGYPAVVLRPASDGMFGYYGGRTSLRDWFCAEEAVKTNPGAGRGRLVRLTAAGYARMRGGLLAGTAHIALDERALSFQSGICGQMGGGLFAIDLPDGGNACAVIERDGAEVYIKELLTRGNAEGALAAIAGAFPADKYIARLPARGAGTGNARRFGMLAADTGCTELAARQGCAWYGPAFD